MTDNEDMKYPCKFSAEEKYIKNSEEVPIVIDKLFPTPGINVVEKIKLLLQK